MEATITGCIRTKGTDWRVLVLGHMKRGPTTQQISIPHAILNPHLEDRGDLVTWLILGIVRVIIWHIRVISILTKYP